jgi:tetratricopeptide (TPR) repeat protein
MTNKKAPDQVIESSGMSLEIRSDPLVSIDTGNVIPPVAPDSYITHLQAFTAHMRGGNPQAALTAASEACHAAPNRPEPHYAYGEAWVALGEPARAEQAFAAAIQIAPAWADAWINFGLCRYRQGAIEDAKSAMRNALRHAPNNRAAAANLGAFMRISGEPEAAEILLRRSIDTEPDNAAARLNLTADLLQEERAADALALLNEAPALPEDLRTRRHWFLQKSLALLQLNRPAEARSVLEALAALGPIPPEIGPLWLWRQVLLAMGEGDPQRAMQAAEAMRKALDSMGPDAVPEHRIMAHYDLAKFWSGQNRHDTAFGHWTQGHALLKQIQPFSRAEHLATIDANIAAFPKTRFERPAIARNNDPAPVFIVGMPRSGTTLCQQILAAHAQVHGAGERSALIRMAAQLGDPAAIAALDSDTLDTAANDYLAELHALAPDKIRIVDKMPGNYLHLGLVGLLLPKAKIIHCVRDPRDIGLSIFTFRFHGHHGYAHDLADLGWTIAQQERIMAHWRDVLPNPVLTVKLSDWVEDFDGTLLRVLALVDLPHDANCARFYETESRVRTVSRSQVKQPVNARGLGRWRTYEAELQPLIVELDSAGALSGWGG